VASVSVFLFGEKIKHGIERRTLMVLMSRLRKATVQEL
jgi:hypothetical protein